MVSRRKPAHRPEGPGAESCRNAGGLPHRAAVLSHAHAAAESMKIQLPLAALMLGAATAFSVAATVNPPPAGVVVCGGIGSDERRELEEQARGTNLSMEFFVANHRAYVAGVDVALTPLDGAGAGRR